MMPTRKAVVRSKSIPAPVGGLNARDAIANMPETDAIVMDNWFPETSSVRVRNGYTKWATALPGVVETLMTYSGGTGRKLFAASASGFYDCSVKGDVGAAVVTGLTNARWQYVNFGTPGGQFLYAVNGVDYPQIYNGSTWQQVTGTSTPFALTGVDPRNLINVNLHKSRLWFVEKNSFRAWYLPALAISGAATVFELGPLFKRGGALVQMITFTLNSNAGIEDYAVFVSSEGEIAMYRGTDPTSATTWSLVAQFHIGRPVGNRFAARFGSDQIMITADGFYPLSKALKTDRSATQDAVSEKIVQMANGDVAAYSANFGWQIQYHPIANKILVNVPASGGAYQYVMNTITGAWCRFTGWNAACFQSFGDQLMFGGPTYVAWCDQGGIDDTVPITADLKPAFSYFGARTSKLFTMVRPLMQVDGKLNLKIDLNTDFRDMPPQSLLSPTSGAGALWNAGNWNNASWQGGTQLRSDWQSVFGTGFSATLRMRCTTQKQTVILQSIDYVYQPGGIL